MEPDEDNWKLKLTLPLNLIITCTKLKNEETVKFHTVTSIGGGVDVSITVERKLDAINFIFSETKECRSVVQKPMLQTKTSTENDCLPFVSQTQSPQGIHITSSDALCSHMSNTGQLPKLCRHENNWGAQHSVAESLVKPLIINLKNNKQYIPDICTFKEAFSEQSEDNHMGHVAEQPSAESVHPVHLFCREAILLNTVHQTDIDLTSGHDGCRPTLSNTEITDVKGVDGTPLLDAVIYKWENEETVTEECDDTGYWPLCDSHGQLQQPSDRNVILHDFIAKETTSSDSIPSNDTQNNKSVSHDHNYCSVINFELVESIKLPTFGRNEAKAQKEINFSSQNNERKLNIHSKENISNLTPIASHIIANDSANTTCSEYNETSNNSHCGGDMVCDEKSQKYNDGSSHVSEEHAQKETKKYPKLTKKNIPKIKTMSCSVKLSKKENCKKSVSKKRRKNVKKKQIAIRCVFCQKVFRQATLLRTHPCLQKTNVQSCPICGETFHFEFGQKYEQHVASHVETFPNTCPLCAKFSKSKKTWWSHVQNYHSLKVLSCTYCTKQWTIPPMSWLIKHLNVHRIEQGSNPKKTTAIPPKAKTRIRRSKCTIFHCKYQNCKQISGKQGIKNHGITHYSRRTLCSRCNLFFFDIKHLYYHQARKVCPETQSENCQAKYACLFSPACSVLCDTKSDIESHLPYCRFQNEEISMKSLKMKQEVLISKQNISGENYNVQTMENLPKTSGDRYLGETGKQITCPFIGCERRFSMYSKADKHIDLEHEGKKIPCPDCEKMFSHCKTFTTHQLNSHSDIHSTGFAEQYRCQTCKKVFSVASVLNQHIVDVHCTQKCELCIKTYNNAAHLKEHIKRVHLHMKPVNSYKCKDCDKTFAKMGERRQHHNIEHSEKYKCVFCDKKYGLSYQLKEHMREHKGQKPFHCHTCNKSFTHKGTFTMHCKVHSNPNSVLCKICGEKFTVPCSLKCHMKTRHSSIEKKFKCDICKKAFHLRKFLKHHMVIHSDERPYPCSVCGKSFKLEHILRYHMRHSACSKTHYLQCEICSKHVANKCDLVRHKKVAHSTSKPFLCSSCGKAFKTNANLSRHMKTKAHGEEK